ncbi:hypothetical protein Pcinc_029659 [Petrolisthes cinctipes]|uniref:Uncharacterized protein n=1 Tax=Petrolisthes cinctipes TaxID=88211 RepID=A0AAE1K756_PETCI|nr:hypothetical protein Pcinc_029659 [Petrolisthes cinctipes]
MTTAAGAPPPHRNKSDPTNRGNTLSAQSPFMRPHTHPASHHPLLTQPLSHSSLFLPPRPLQHLTTLQTTTPSCRTPPPPDPTSPVLHLIPSPQTSETPLTSSNYHLFL